MNDENNLYNDLLDLLDTIKDKMKNNDSSCLINPFDSSYEAKDQSYFTGGHYSSQNLSNLSSSSTSTQSGLNGGSITYGLFIALSTTTVIDHEIFLKEKTVISDCIRIDVRIFKNCTQCFFSEISVINPGNIVIPMYDYLNTNGEKSFNGLLKYYYKINNKNIKT